METYSGIGSRLARESCCSSKLIGSGDRSFMGERKASLIVFASSDILGVPRRCSDVWSDRSAFRLTQESYH